MKNKQYFLLALVFMGIFFAVLLVEQNRGQVTKSVIERETPGNGEREEELVLDAGEVLQDYDYFLTVEEQKISTQKARELVEQSIQEIEDSFFAPEQIPDYVEKQVYPKEWYQEGLVEADWRFDPQELVDTEGNLCDEKLDRNGQLIHVNVILTCGNYQGDYAFSFLAFPKDRSEQEHLLFQIAGQIREQMESDENTQIQLPESVNGVPLVWKEKKENLAIKVLLLEVVCFFLLILREKENVKKKQLLYQESVERDYPEMAHKLTVLLGAGVSIRQAWRKTAMDYQKKRDEQGIPKRQIYEEMLQTCRQIQDGMTERDAYHKFAERTNLSCCRRMVRILLQNMQKGSNSLCVLLEQETQSAFAKRKNLARKQGEEAGTKLLFPMIMMLGIIMAIVMVPAFIQL